MADRIGQRFCAPLPFPLAELSSRVNCTLASEVTAESRLEVQARQDKQVAELSAGGAWR